MAVVKQRMSKSLHDFQENSQKPTNHQSLLSNLLILASNSRLQWFGLHTHSLWSAKNWALKIKLFNRKTWAFCLSSCWMTLMTIRSSLWMDSMEMLPSGSANTPILTASDGAVISEWPERFEQSLPISVTWSRHSTLSCVNVHNYWAIGQSARINYLGPVNLVSIICRYVIVRQITWIKSRWDCFAVKSPRFYLLLVIGEELQRHQRVVQHENTGRILQFLVNSFNFH